MKTKLIPLFLAAATICATHAQSSSGLSRAENRPVTRSSAEVGARDKSDEIAKVKAELGMLRLKYTEQHPNVVDAKRRLAELENQPALGDLPSAGFGSTARYGQRLNTIVRRSDAATPGSIILTSAMSQQKLDELSEDLTVLNYIFTRNFERMFGDKGTDYRLGVAMTMSGSRLVETSYLEDFGVLIKVHVPFPLIGSGDNDKKVETTSTANSEWEKARRALFGAPAEVSADGNEARAPFDSNLVDELKNQMFDALKSAANIRNYEPNQPITVVVIGGPSALKVGSSPRSTIMTIRITKAQADAAAKDSSDLSKQATVNAYFDSANASSAPRWYSTSGYGSGFGGGGSSYGGAYPSATPASR